MAAMLSAHVEFGKKPEKWPLRRRRSWYNAAPVSKPYAQTKEDDNARQRHTNPPSGLGRVWAQWYAGKDSGAGWKVR